MSRRRPSRRERTERRDRLREAEAAGIPVPQPRAPKDPPLGVSYAGAGGGALGFAITLGLGIAILAGASDESSTWCVPFFVLAAMFVPSIYASIKPAARRNEILRATVAGCLISAIVGYVIGLPELTFLLTLPTVLLAQAAGLIFQGGQAKP